MQFFNTAILLFIVNYNMIQDPVTFGLVGGSLRDFNRTWFKILGNTIVGTMVITGSMPLVGLAGNYTRQFLERAWDRGFSINSVYKTKKTGLKEYIDLHSGPPHSIHFAFSQLLVIVFVTFMFGFGIPILFPIAFVSIFVLYHVEKICMYYRYRRPPMYDEHVTQLVQRLLRLAPVMYLFSAYWMLTNK